MQEKVDALEVGMFRLESTMSSFAENMGEKIGSMTSSIAQMSQVLSTLNVTQSKVNRLEDDVKALAGIHRKDTIDINSKLVSIQDNMQVISDANSAACVSRIQSTRTELDDKGSDRLKFSLQLTFGAMSFVIVMFGIALRYIHMTNVETNTVVKENQRILHTHELNFKDIENKLGKANGHRRYIQEELSHLKDK